MNAFAGRVLLITTTALLSACVANQGVSNSAGSGAASHSPAPLYRSMTDADVIQANGALDRALEHNLSGTAASWRNRSSGNHGGVTPLRTYRSSNGGYCRAYQEALVIGNHSELYTATACRDPLGLWQPIK